MKLSYLVPLCTLVLSSHAFGWGQEGHSIVAEIAQRHLNINARTHISKTLGNGISLASVSSWADDVRDSRSQTRNWHFVDIPVIINTYDATMHCKPSAHGDCIVAELTRLKNEIRCASTDLEKAEALRFAIHFVGDIHQPFHTVDDAKGGNLIRVAVYVAGETCTGTCSPTPTATNLHTVWDSIIIQKASWNWGALADQINVALLPGSPAGSLDPKDWAEETHLIAQQMWALSPKNAVIDEQYYLMALPVVQKQLGLAGLRLAKFLNDAYASNTCPTP